MPAAALHAKAPMDDQHPLASRGGSDTVELRQHISRDISQVIEAVARARRVDRCDVIAEILKEWADSKLHEATLIQRFTRGNGTGSESNGGRSE